MLDKIKKDYALWVCNLIFMIVAIFIYLVTAKWNLGVFNSILNNIASVLVVSGIYNVLYEYILKTRLIESIDEKMNLKSKITKTGVLAIESDIKNINYTDFFKQVSKNIDIFHIYGRTWTNNNSDTLKRILSANKKIS